MSKQRWGANPDDWTLLSVVAGLTEDLLPVVSNPGARIDPNSKLKTLGKVPSLYNGSGLCVGLPRWTQKTANPRDIDRWSQQPDYGICLQTRRVRALDIDIDDPDDVVEILDIVSRHIPEPLPMRHRADSSKCLLAFELEGPFTKRILKTDNGAIEFLATGQQFIAAGTHTGGARYEWEGGTPAEFPEVRLEDFEACWAELMHRFATEEAIEYREGRALKEQRHAVSVQDDLATFLLDEGWVKSETNDGRLNITCPFEHEHSGPSADDTATQYFPKGVGGFDVGHFKCLHAHCANRNDGDFIEATGFVAQQFDVVELTEEEQQAEAALPDFDRNPKTGAILTTLSNVVLALRSPQWLGVEVGKDVFRDEVMVTRAGRREWRPFTDADYTRLRLQLNGKGIRQPGADLVKDSVVLVAEDNLFDSAILWLEEEVPPWDGVSRIERFYPDYFGAEDTPYTRAVGMYTWTALAGRVLEPGCKVDMAPILRGAQGQRKSAAVAAMVPHPDQFVELDLSGRDDDMSRLMRGRLLAELGELQGLHNREVEAVKAFITRRFEQWVPKFREFATSFPRRLLFIGTTNRKEFLADDTGNRRWLPMEVSRADVARIEHDRLQLWAEARETWTAMGIAWREAEQLARYEHDAYRIRDMWEEAIERWLYEEDELAGTRPADRPLHSHDILVGALRMDPRTVKRGDEMRLGQAMAALGFERRQRRIDGSNRKVWVHTGAVEGAADGTAE